MGNGQWALCTTQLDSTRRKSKSSKKKKLEKYANKIDSKAKENIHLTINIRPQLLIFHQFLISVNWDHQRAQLCSISIETHRCIPYDLGLGNGKEEAQDELAKCRHSGVWTISHWESSRAVLTISQASSRSALLQSNICEPSAGMRRSIPFSKIYNNVPLTGEEWAIVQIAYQ